MRDPRLDPTDADPAGRHLVLAPLAVEHLDQVLAIERHSFVSPWRREHFEQEIRRGGISCNRVMLDGKRVAAYLCMWIIEREAQINNLAVDPALRRRGLGRRLLRVGLELARRRGCVEALLEVRVSNLSAIELYREQGFAEIGRRKGYYASEDEDALVFKARLSAARPGNADQA